ncbi:MAG TPA: carbon starvation CstA family protein, partial [Chthoniobacteraceae bacterium]|nr:carbon starvation CstA family protein [Chthoniobacteraceae bacterium]
IQMPGFTPAIHGGGPIIKGPLFPFVFITIACGAISGFHSLISSGITPKIITRESHARPVGYGAMCLESLVAIMAMIAACTLDPGVYLAMNIPGSDPAVTAAAVTNSGLTRFEPYWFRASDGAPVPGTYARVPVSVSPDTMQALATQMGEVTLFGRTGGAATLAVGMAMIFSKLTQGRWLDLWYHFALMFEALFILTTLDAGTRVGRYLLQDSLRRIAPPLADTKNIGASIFASAVIVAAWGFFLIMGVRDPDGGVKALWPIFGIANQLLASIALCLATTILLKMQLQRQRSPFFAFVTLIPLAWLLTVTISASVIKVWDPNPRIGFLAAARTADEKIPGLEEMVAASQSADTPAWPAAVSALKKQRTVRFNNTVDAWVTGIFLVLVSVIVVLSVAEWLRLLARSKSPALSETPPVWLPAGAIEPARPLPAFGIAALAFTLLKELSGQSAIEREETRAQACNCEKEQMPRARQNAFLTATERRFNGINRCC